MARIEELKNYIYIIGTNYSIKIPKNIIQKILFHRITKVYTIQTKIGKVVFTQESEPMVFPK